MPEQQGFLARSGLDSINVGGHKVPIALIGGIAALAGVFLVLRARSQRSQVATVGQVPGSAAESGFGMPLPGTDVGPALANISQQLNQLSQQGLAGPVPAAPQAPQYALRPTSGGVRAYQTFAGSEADFARMLQQEYGGQLRDYVNRLDFFNPGGPVGGQFYYPLNVREYTDADRPYWQTLIVR